MSAARRPAVFLDRDGVINVDHGYVCSRDRLEWITGVFEALSRLKQAGYLLIVVTNQAGIGRGYYDEAALHSFHRLLNEELTRHGGGIDAFYFCPFHADASVERYRHPDHPDRKPNPGMLLQAMRDWPIDPARSFLIGDKTSDVAAAQAAGVTGYLFEGGNLDELVDRILDGAGPAS
ncbi:D-glycero-alpha-D-manno-heptose-1,7-bisphosphate 7-phosphatase [Maricaulis sp.]|uniref:D-glycero-alpha-D-manno-heptose-1,7-bisphosphate 7-phosphatase n=1 Tax=Maricaulis sp. TaxID=1486257 RepID=UPI003A920F01